MKIMNTTTLRALGRMAAPFVSLASNTLRVELDNRGQLTDPWDPKLKERYVYALWHESQLGMMALRCANHCRGVNCLAHAHFGTLVIKFNFCEASFI